MAFNGTGTFVRLYNWQQDAANDIDISADRMDAEDSGFAAGLSMCVTRDGQGVPTAAIYWGNQNLTGVNVFGAASGAFTGALTVGATFGATGNVTFGGTASVAGNATFGGTVAVTGNVTFSGTLAVTGAAALGTGSTVSDPASNARPVGYRGMPKKAISTAYTVTVADVGYCLEIVAGGSITFPRNSTLVGAAQFSAHDSTIVIQNTLNSTVTLSAATSATLTNVADGTSGNKTLKAKGRVVADLSLSLADTWFIGGSI